MNVNCGAQPCPVILNSTCVFYEGANLIYTGINTNDNLQTALEKIDAKFADAALGYIFQNGIIQSAPGQPVKLGGSLTQNTVINSAGYTFQLTGTIESSAFITSGGTSSQFVKGDGSLDSTSYQPAGNYITGLTGDGTATGPGNVPFTLATVNSNPGTYGSSTLIPIVTVNTKGLVTNVTTTAVNIPSGAIILQGDVTGVGTTGVPLTTTLATVNANVYGTDTPLKFAVNGKGLVTSASPLTALDIIGILGYTPVPDSRTITINGVTFDLSANRTWSVGTVTSVDLQMPAAFAVSGNPITSSGTLVVTGTGTISQYVRGDGSLGNFPTFFGSSGTSGDGGSSGTSGQDGSSGTSGMSGVTGTSGTSGGTGSSGTSGATGSSGTSGEAGSSGTSGVSGSGGTSGSSGSSGESGTSGTNGVSGTSGTNGTTGSSGSSGSSGSAGTSGLSGSSGTSGISGTSGTSGSAGTSGVSSTSGTSGIAATSGTSGTTGSSGSSGLSGTSGSSGSSGNSGTSGTSGLAATSGTSGSSATSGTS